MKNGGGFGSNVENTRFVFAGKPSVPTLLDRWIMEPSIHVTLVPTTMAPPPPCTLTYSPTAMHRGAVPRKRRSS